MGPSRGLPSSSSVKRRGQTLAATAALPAALRPSSSRSAAARRRASPASSAAAAPPGAPGPTGRRAAPAPARSAAADSCAAACARARLCVGGTARAGGDGRGKAAPGKLGASRDGRRSAPARARSRHCVFPLQRVQRVQPRRGCSDTRHHAHAGPAPFRRAGRRAARGCGRAARQAAGRDAHHLELARVEGHLRLHPPGPVGRRRAALARRARQLQCLRVPASCGSAFNSY